MNIYEMYGRQAEELTLIKAYYDATQKVLLDLKNGAVLPSALVITQTGWQIDGQRSEGGDDAA